MDPSIFRAYDIRGDVQTQLTPNVVYQIGKAIGSRACDLGETSIAVGRDGRLSGPEHVIELMRGIQETGCHVFDLGAVPTPLVYFATHQLATKSGVMLTGSHNPPNYNGLKIVLNHETLALEKITALYTRCQQQNFHQGHGESKAVDLLPAYIKAIKESIQLARPLKIVVDAGNGIAGPTAEAVFKELGCEVVALYCDVDGNFPHHHPDPTQPENLTDLIASVMEEKADVGLALDGDGDRLGIVTNQGDVIWADRLLLLYAKSVLSQHPNSKIVYDVKCTRYLDPCIKKWGGEPVMWKTGHSLIKEKLKKENALLAGEMSGHIYFADRWYGFDDAIYAAARLLELIAAQDKSISELFAALPNAINTPELHIPVSDADKFSIIERLQAQEFSQAANVIKIDGVRVEFADGWGLVRASNTTPNLVLRFEADDQASLERIKEHMRHALQQVGIGADLAC